MDSEKKYELQRKGVRKNRKGNISEAKKTKASQWEKECISIAWNAVNDALGELNGNG